jgi:hypothetical protein
MRMVSDFTEFDVRRIQSASLAGARRWGFSTKVPVRLFTMDNNLVLVEVYLLALLGIFCLSFNREQGMFFIK